MVKGACVLYGGDLGTHVGTEYPTPDRLRFILAGAGGVGGAAATAAGRAGAQPAVAPRLVPAARRAWTRLPVCRCHCGSAAANGFMHGNLIRLELWIPVPSEQVSPRHRFASCWWAQVMGAQTVPTSRCTQQRQVSPDRLPAEPCRSSAPPCAHAEVMLADSVLPARMTRSLRAIRPCVCLASKTSSSS